MRFARPQPGSITNGIGERITKFFGWLQIRCQNSPRRPGGTEKSWADRESLCIASGVPNIQVQKPDHATRASRFQPKQLVSCSRHALHFDWIHPCLCVSVVKFFSRPTLEMSPPGEREGLAAWRRGRFRATLSIEYLTCRGLIGQYAYRCLRLEEFTE